MILKVIFANSVDPNQEQSDQGPHCLPVCKNSFEKFAKIFNRRLKQMSFSDAGFLGILRVKDAYVTVFPDFIYKSVFCGTHSNCLDLSRQFK